MKHNYTNELELKSILIRIKNARIVNNTVNTAKTICVETRENTIKNRRIDKYIRWYKSKNKKNKEFQERRTGTCCGRNRRSGGRTQRGVC